MIRTKEKVHYGINFIGDFQMMCITGFAKCISSDSYKKISSSYKNLFYSNQFSIVLIFCSNFIIFSFVGLSLIFGVFAFALAEGKYFSSESRVFYKE